MKKLITRSIPIVALTLISTLSPALAQEATDAAAAAPVPEVNTGNTAWLLMCSALVMLMTPGLAFFYAGMVNRKNVVSTMLQNYAALGVVGLLWVIIGYSLAFSPGNGFIGGLDYFMLNGVQNTLYSPESGVPHFAFMAFQMMFAIITPALITGAIAERVHFAAWLLFMSLWSLCVYVPIAHWVWAADGWLFKMGGLDFAGGLVVHMSSAFSALVAAILFGRRVNVSEVSRPNDVTQIMLGAALLWFGWFGFNAGSAITAGQLASQAFVITFVGAAAAFVAWVLVDWLLHKKPSAVGAAIGLVVGLVIVTPAAGFISVGSAIALAGIGAVICNLVARWVKSLSHLDDSLDVFACHGMGGLIGAIGTGLLASSAMNSAVAVDGLLIGGEMETFKANVIGALVVAAYSIVVTFILIKIVGIITPIRVSQEAEAEGLDTSVHGEVARFHDRRHIS